MGITVDVHQVYKYPFEQVVASFLRKLALWCAAACCARLGVLCPRGNPIRDRITSPSTAS
ncbi:Hypothetical predicted protein, partial [Marmota monax]